DIEVPSDISLSGGNLYFTSRNAQLPVSLEFTGSDSAALTDLSSLVFDTLSGLSFTGYKKGAISTSGNLIIQNVNDGVEDSENPDVFFSGNSNSRVGAISASGDVIISGNGDVSFTGNTGSSSSYASSRGGAIYAEGVSISGNVNVTFTGNTFSSSSSDCVGGAISAEGVSISGNGDVSFTGNTVSSSASGSVGGAISASGDVIISGNGDVSFTGNAASSSYFSRGGAIYAFRGGVSIIGNGDVTFSENAVSSPSSSSPESIGGAIYAEGVSISGNETVCFEKNYESENSTYRLRSIYTTKGLNLSAKTGGHIAIYDSVYGGTTSLNADYTDAEGNTQQAKGNIIFSGQYTKTHLDAILEENGEGREATDAEILNSCTSTLGDTTLYGGLLQVVDGAILSTTSLTVAAGSSASVLLQDAELNGSISFGANTSLELQGANTTTGSLTLGDAVSLSVTLDNSHLETAALTLTGSVSTGTLCLNLNVAEERATGMYRILSAGSMATEASWTAENVSVQGSGAAAGATFGDLIWLDGTLFYEATPVWSTPVWSNHSGTMVWSSTDTNWNNGSAFRAGQDVVFKDCGAGEVQLAGELAPTSIYVRNTAGNDYAFTGSGKLSGNTSLTKTGAGELTIATANDYTGRTELQEGTLNVHHSTALGATATGGASLTTAAGTTLKVGNTSHLVLAGSSNSLAGAVEVAGGSSLEMKGSGYAAISSAVDGTLAFTGTTASTETLTGSGTVQVTDSQVTVGKISRFTGNLQVEGKGSGLSIAEGSYTGVGTLNVAGGTLTFGAKGNITLNAGGRLELQSWDDAVAGVIANNITVDAGATLAAKAGVAALGDMPEISNQEFSVDLNCARLTLEAGATLDAEGACFDLNNGMLTLAVTPDSAEKIELVLAGNAVYTGSEQIIL
ncbi:MAG: autotransporter-associated beta strand repeat-containing protein, partial [Akkermansia sp.]|nr:autotransporter-associated beta strand repeat-containing protein [Akkermansia sp.]